MKNEYSRKQFLRMFPFGFREILHENGGEPEIKKEVSVFRPPGAVEDEKHFTKLCERCKKCGAACPHDVIYYPGIKAGTLENTPLLNPVKKPCRWCRDMPCIKACKSGALKRAAFNKIAKIGRAYIDLELCSTSNGILCDICVSACPSTIKAVRLNTNRQPEISVEKCTGCGLCAYYCDATPGAITIIK